MAWFWQFRAVVDYRNVENVGLTNLLPGSYAWLGATTRFNFFFFPEGKGLPAELTNRFSLVVTAQAYWDAYSGQSIYRITPELAYKLSDDGASSVSIQYDQGTDKDTLKQVKQYSVKLNYKY